MKNLLKTHLDTLGLSVCDQSCGQLLWLAEELLRWNRRVNLTAITQAEAVIEKHIVDSLTLMPYLSGCKRLLDVGSGGGFPGLPLKIVLRDLGLVSVDAVGKKINFQRHVVRQLGLTECTPLHMRIEDVPSWEGFGVGFDVVVSRAFSSLEDFVGLALPCLAPGGRMIAMKGPEGALELAQGAEMMTKWGIACVGVDHKKLPGSGAERLLIVLEKI